MYNVYTDGSYRMATNVGGAAWVVSGPSLPQSEGSKRLTGFQKAARPHGSDYAELTAVALALKAIPNGAVIELYGDAQNVQRWLEAGSLASAKADKRAAVQDPFSQAVMEIRRMQAVRFNLIAGKNNEKMNRAHILSRAASTPG